MSKSFVAQQARVDTFLARATVGTPDYIRLLRYAKVGVQTPNRLTSEEVQQVCDALVTHYAQMGIG